MRKIEHQMLDAIKQGVNKSLGNTLVTIDKLGQSLVFLHGNHIATVNDNTITINMRDCATTTTRSRLNALLLPFNAGISQRRGEQYLITNLLGQQTLSVMPINKDVVVFKWCN